MDKLSYRGCLQSIINAIEGTLNKESYRVDISKGFLTPDQKWELYDLTAKVNDLLANALLERSETENVSLNDYILEAKASTSIREMISFSEYFDENVKKCKSSDVKKFALRRLNHLRITSKRSTKSFQAYIKCREADIIMNECIWQDACEEIKAIKELLGQLANFEDGSINRIIISHYEQYFSDYFSSINNEIIKEMHDVDNDGHRIASFNDTNITKEQWSELLDNLYCSLRKKKFDFLVDWNYNVIQKADNQLMIDFLLSTDNPSDYDKFFYLLSKINIIKSKINPVKQISTTTHADLRKKLDKIIPMIRMKRNWFPVFKGLFEKKYVNNGDFNEAADLILKCYPEGLPVAFNIKDLSRLNTQSFSKSIKLWDISNAPVTGKLYSQYQKLGLFCLDIL